MKIKLFVKSLFIYLFIYLFTLLFIKALRHRMHSCSVLSVTFVARYLKENARESGFFRLLPSQTHGSTWHIFSTLRIRLSPSKALNFFNQLQ